jgi:hypothetical protein
MIAEQKRYQREIRRIQKLEEKRRKELQIIHQQQIARDKLKERENKAEERGLRNRMKPEGSSSKMEDAFDAEDNTYEKRNETEMNEDDGLELHANEQLNFEGINTE